LKRIQRDLAENDERQTEERAEMSAQKTLIQQDSKLRSQIAEEERKKFLKEKESYLDDVLKKEKLRLQQQAELEVSGVVPGVGWGWLEQGSFCGVSNHDELTIVFLVVVFPCFCSLFFQVEELKKSFRRGTGISAREKELEMQAVQDSADREVLLLEIQGLKKSHQNVHRGNQNLHNNWIAEHQMDTKNMIQEMMVAFEEEMSGMRNRCLNAEKLLVSATRDIEYLMEENEHLRNQVSHK